MRKDEKPCVDVGAFVAEVLLVVSLAVVGAGVALVVGAVLGSV